MLKTVSSVTNAIGALNYKGTWNADTNTPTLTSSVGIKGDYYVVNVAGTTTLDGVNNWGVGDWVTFNGSVWQRVEGGADLNGENISYTGTLTGGSGIIDIGSGQFYKDASGNIGINTTSPQAKVNLADGSFLFSSATNQTSFNRFVTAQYPMAESTVVSNKFTIGNRLSAALPDRGASIRFVQSGTTNIFGEAASVVEIWTWRTGFDNGNPRLTIAANGNTHPSADDVYDIGTASFRWNDVFATNGTIQTSDVNEKQDIEELSETERRVAVTAKSLLRKFRWKSSVEVKGSDARIHFGIIAQELQAAFEAEGLDAGRYGMFTDTAWWESYVNVPAVEAKDAVFNENGDLIEEAVRAQDAHVRTDTYHSEKEAPAGAVKKSRMGIRYSELLAFIISAT